MADRPKGCEALMIMGYAFGKRQAIYGPGPSGGSNSLTLMRTALYISSYQNSFSVSSADISRFAGGERAAPCVVMSKQVRDEATLPVEETRNSSEARPRELQALSAEVVDLFYAQTFSPTMSTPSDVCAAFSEML